MFSDGRAQLSVLRGLFRDSQLDKTFHHPLKHRTLLRYQLSPPVGISGRLLAGWS